MFKDVPQAVIFWSSGFPARRTITVQKHVVHTDEINVSPGSARRDEKGLFAGNELVCKETERPDVFRKRSHRIVTEEIFWGCVVDARTAWSLHSNLLRTAEVS